MKQKGFDYSRKLQLKLKSRESDLKKKLLQLKSLNKNRKPLLKLRRLDYRLKQKKQSESELPKKLLQRLKKLNSLRRPQQLKHKEL